MASSQTFTLLLLVGLQFLVGLVSSACIDGKNNVVYGGDASSNNVIQVSNGVGNTYDSKSSPSCYKNAADIQLPGILDLVSGQVTVNRKLSLVGNSKALLTLKKNSIFIGYVCKDGKSKNILVPDSDCNLDICSLSTALCSIFEQPGTYNLADLEKNFGVNGSLPLPSLPSALKSVIKGQWRVEIKLQAGDDIVMHIKAPSDTEWVWLDEN